MDKYKLDIRPSQYKTQPADIHTLKIYASAIVNTPLSLLRTHRYVIRERLGDISDLVTSIQENGILQPLIVKPEGEVYSVVIGSRRLLAAKQTNRQYAPVIIYEMTDDEVKAFVLLKDIQHPRYCDPRLEKVSKALCLMLERHSSIELAKALGISDNKVSQLADILEQLSKPEENGIRTVYLPFPGIELAAEYTRSEIHMNKLFYDVIYSITGKKIIRHSRISTAGSIDFHLNKKLKEIYSYMLDNSRRMTDAELTDKLNYARDVSIILYYHKYRSRMFTPLITLISLLENEVHILYNEIQSRKRSEKMGIGEV